MNETEIYCAVNDWKSKLGVKLITWFVFLYYRHASLSRRRKYELLFLTRYGKLFNGHRDLANLYCFRERFPISQEIDVFVTKIELFLRKIPKFPRNQLFCAQNRIVSEKDSQIRTKSMFLWLKSNCFRERFPNSHEIDFLCPKSYCFWERFPISHEIDFFVPKIVLFLRKIPKFTGNRCFCD